MIRDAKLFFGCIFFTIFVQFSTIYAQGEGGVSNIFNKIGIGSRAISMGNAYVAIAHDPAVVFFNPGALGFVEKKSASFFYSNLIAGSSYSFVGFVYPTISIGSFGFGWIRIGTDGINEYDENAVKGNSFGINQQLFLFSYAKSINDHLALGSSLRIERFSSFGVSDAGFGLDFGFFYKPDFENDILRDVQVGLNLQNLVTPSLRIVEESVKSERNIRFGFAKPITWGEQNNKLLISFDINKNSRNSATLHFGSEFRFQDKASIRFGFNDGTVAFGAGATYRNIHIDYSYGKLFDAQDFNANHRFTVTFEFGKSKTELIRIAEERRQRELQRQVQNQIWFSRESEFYENMEAGRTKMSEGDYLAAYVHFNNALEAANTLLETALNMKNDGIDESEVNIKIETANSAIEEARTLLEQADQKYDAQQEELRKKYAVEATQSALAEELQRFILEHREKGNEFFKNGDFSKAISEWQLVLNRINTVEPNLLPNWAKEEKAKIEKDIQMAEEQIKGNVKETIRRANALAKRKDYVQALAILNDLMGKGLTSSERVTVENKIKQFEIELNFQRNFDQGIRYYDSKDFKMASEFFEKALKIKPRDPLARKYFEEAKARAIATVQAMPPDVRKLYIKGLQLFRQGKYKEAIDIWEQAREKQPYNKRILDLIDLANDKLKNQQ